MRKRSIILNTAICFIFVIVVVRLFNIMIVNHERLYARAKMQQLKGEDMRVRRGMILDRHGRELAVNLELESLYCDPAGMGSPEKSAAALSSVTGKPSHAILTKLSSEGHFVWLERKLDPDTTRRVKDLKLKGIGFVNDSKRYYPKGNLASQIVGFVNIDNKGIEGVELRYDGYLSSGGGKVLFSRDANGKTLSQGVEMESKGNNLVLTLDEGLQYAVEVELDRAMEQWRASAATAIMMDPFTGEILALANRPSFDPNSISGSRNFERRNRAITDCYEPGSTFKIIVGTAALEERVVSLGSTFDCSKGAIEIGKRVVHDAHKHGVLTFTEVIQKSSNVGSIMVGMKLGKERIYRYAKAFGFGEKTGIDLPGEVSGLIRPPERWSGVSIGSVPIGQEVAVTPLQVLRAYSAIANGGMLVTPHVVSRALSPEGEEIWRPAHDVKRVISRGTAETFKNILKTVTEEGGTAKSAAVSGNNVAGKTGTAQIIDPRTKRYSTEKFVSSFVGFVPADDPKIAMIVVVYEPRGEIYGGVVAAPVFKRIAENALSYLNVPREDIPGNMLVVSR
ncbi:MAG TPA: penicillin-binding protein 2 [Thermodesulfovibrionales bacterium]|nr:penicillin-binding protein 2 [Thermodesulfovibrionales bacterium]